MSALSTLTEIQENLSFFEDRTERIQALIALGQSFTPFAGAEKPYAEHHRVPGCESEAFAWTFADDGKLRLEFVIENPQGISAMVMASILQRCLNGLPPSEAQTIPDEVVFEIFGRELSMGKSGGLMNMVRLIKAQAKSL